MVIYNYFYFEIYIYFKYNYRPINEIKRNLAFLNNMDNLP